MNQLRAFFTAVLVSAALVVPSPALAAIVRQPESGSPAFVVNTPPGVNVSRDGANLFITLDGQPGGLMLSLDEVHDLDAHSLTDLATLVLEAAGAEPSSRQEPAWVDGVAGEQFYSRMNPNSDAVMHLRLFLAKVEGRYFASLAVMYAETISPEQLRRLEGLAASVKITRGRGGATSIGFSAPQPGLGPRPAGPGPVV